MFDYRTGPWAVFLLRIALGLIFLAHGIVMKVEQWTLPGTAERFASLGLPQGLAYAVCGIEIFAGTLLVLGVQARWVALGMLPILVGAVWAHWGNGWLFLNDGGGWEYPLYLAVLAIAQALIGDGRLALSPTRSLASLSGPPPALNDEWQRARATLNPGRGFGSGA